MVRLRDSVYTLPQRISLIRDRRPEKSSRPRDPHGMLRALRRGLRIKNAAPTIEKVTRDELEALRTPQAVAARLLSKGLWPLPISSPRSGRKNAGKAPLGKGWGLTRPTCIQIGDVIRREDAGVGLLLGVEGRVIDIEVDDPEAAAPVLERMFPGGIPDTLGWESNRGWHKIFAWDGRLSKYGEAIIAGHVLPGGKTSGNLHYAGVEIRLGALSPERKGKQYQSVCPPSPRADGTPRRWIGTEIQTLPESVFLDLDRYVTPKVIRAPRETTAPSEADAYYATTAIQTLDPNMSYPEWIEIGFALRALGDEGFEIWDSWSSGAPSYPGPEALWKLWEPMDEEGGISLGTLFHRATEAGWERPASPAPRFEDAPIPVPGPIESEDVQATEEIGTTLALHQTEEEEAEPGDVQPEEVAEDRQDDPEDVERRLRAKIDQLGWQACIKDPPTLAAFGWLEMRAQGLAVVLLDHLKTLPRFPRREWTRAVRQAVAASQARQEAEELEGVTDPHRLARIVLDEARLDGELTYRFWKSEAWRWTAGAYRPVADADLKAIVTRIIKAEFDRLTPLAVAAWEARGRVGPTGQPQPRPTTPTVDTKLTSDVVNAFRSLAHLDPRDVADQPAWIGEAPHGWNPRDILPVSNGLLYLGEGRPLLVGHTPKFFGPVALPYPFDPQAPEPSRWLRFLAEVFPNDQESHELVREWFGYCLTEDTSRHKILLMLGESRGGKGTIGRALTHLIGQANTANPKLRALADTFGLAGLVGKRIAVVGDVRFGSKTDTAAILENLLALSGEDGVEVNEKHKPQKHMRIGARFALASNEIPQFPDSSSAIASRLLVLNFTQSFRGREDLTLEAQLIRELPGILNWSIEGLRKLRDRGHFIQPASAGLLIEALADSVSPIKGFIADELQVGPEFKAAKDDLYARWCEWSRLSGRDWSGTKEQFAVKLLAAIPGIRASRPRDGEGNRTHAYAGVGFKGVPSDVAARTTWLFTAYERYGRVPAPRYMMMPGYEGSPTLLGVRPPGEEVALRDYIRRLKLDGADPSGERWAAVSAWADAAILLPPSD
jgi:putative DNA primase/helicase